MRQKFPKFKRDQNAAKNFNFTLTKLKNYTTKGFTRQALVLLLMLIMTQVMFVMSTLLFFMAEAALA